jgi:hypothetical protein
MKPGTLGARSAPENKSRRQQKPPAANRNPIKGTTSTP